jgi:hypothetical protein
MMAKYITPGSIEEWIRKDIKGHRGASIVWKSIARALPLIGKWLVWKIGRENKIKIGEDP